MCIFYTFSQFAEHVVYFQLFRAILLWDHCCENFVFTLAVICVDYLLK